MTEAIQAVAAGRVTGGRAEVGSDSIGPLASVGSATAKGFGRAGFAQDHVATISRMVAAGTIDPNSSVDATDEVKQKRLEQNMLKYLDGLEYEFGVQYAPAEFKAQMHQWSLEAQFQAARDKVQKAHKISVEQFQTIVRDIILSCHDYHVSVRAASSERASLPFSVQSVGEGKDRKYFVVSVDEEAAGKAGLPFGPGAQIVAFDGKPIGEAVDQVRVQIATGDGPTDYALAASSLTTRSAAKIMSVPKGPVSVTVLDEAGRKKECKLTWNYLPEKHPTPASMGGEANRAAAVPVRNLLGGSKLTVGDTTVDGARDLILKNPMQNMSYLSRAEIDEEGDKDPFALGSRRSFVPRLGKVLAEAEPDFPFDWYVYQNAQGKKIGCVRIPDYTPEDANKYVEIFAALMKAMQAHTDALVIDQVNNPGGSVMYLSALASCLTDHPLKTPMHHMAITQKSAQKAEMLEKMAKAILATPDPEATAQKALGPVMEGYPVTTEFVKSILTYAQNILREFDAGHQVTAPSNLFGVDDIEPYPEKDCRYTKPIVFLTNERDFSGGDFMPAIMQDNKRATIFGAKTAGAGGYVNKIDTENLFGIDSIRVTGSLAERATGGKPIEEYGVSPDVPYAVTENDIHSEFAGYADAVNAAVAKAVGQTKSPAASGSSTRARRATRPTS